MVKKLLICGLAAGACGGVLATAFASVAGEPQVDRAIAYEHGRELRTAKTAGTEHSVALPEPVSRAVQKSAGLLVAAVVYGLALAGLLALVFAATYGRIARAGPRATAYGLAAAAFVVVYLVPFIKYPASPPGATNPATIGHRSALYGMMILLSILSAVAAVRLRPWLEERLGGHAGKLGAGLLFLILVTVAGVALPSVNEMPRDFPASTLWSFRLASLGTQAVMWTTIALVFGLATQRVMTGQPVVAWRRGLAGATE
jgi:hypothetical protein